MSGKIAIVLAVSMIACTESTVGIVLPITLIVSHFSAVSSRSAESRTFIEQWNLDRIDQPEPPLDGRYSPGTLGFGVTIYVVDTGIRITHDQVADHARYALGGHDGDFVGDELGTVYGADDCNGHGTHVAGIAAGTTVGVAPGADVASVRVAGCRGIGSPKAVIRAIRWLTDNADHPAVVLMSLDLGDVPEVRREVERSIESGLTYVAASGDSLSDACRASPGGSEGAITVAAMDAEDRQNAFSNFGPCIDIFAPGKDILSADVASEDALKTRRGSSSAAAHVAGAAALFLEKFPSATPYDVKSALIGSASKNVLILTRAGEIHHTPNRLLQVE